MGDCPCQHTGQQVTSLEIPTRINQTHYKVNIRKDANETIVDTTSHSKHFKYNVTEAES